MVDGSWLHPVSRYSATRADTGLSPVFRHFAAAPGWKWPSGTQETVWITSLVTCGAGSW
jgi:hypothetical protein